MILGVMKSNAKTYLWNCSFEYTGVRAGGRQEGSCIAEALHKCLRLQGKEVAGNAAAGKQAPAPDAREALMSAIKGRRFQLKSVGQSRLLNFVYMLSIPILSKLRCTGVHRHQ